MPELRELGVQYIVDANGDKSAVVLPIEQFYQLLEDLDDLAVLPNAATSQQSATKSCSRS